MGQPESIRSVALAVLLGCSLAASTGRSASTLDGMVTEIKDIRILAEALGPRFLKEGGSEGKLYVQHRLIDGETLYYMKDYLRASIVLMDIIENYPNDPAYPDAVFYFADSLFLTRDFLGARDWFKKLLSMTDRFAAKRHEEQALARLIEIAIELKDFKGVERYFASLGQSPGPYGRFIKGKFLYFKGEYKRALDEFETVSGDPLLTLRVKYYRGATLTILGRLGDAVEVFEQGAASKASTVDEQEIVDLLNLAAGRVYYENAQYPQAAEAYGRVQYTSKYFDIALYEAASVLIGAGEGVRAERLLEVLTVMLPESAHIPHARLLRGNMLLKTDRFDEAEDVFDGTIKEFTPVLERLETRVQSKDDAIGFVREIAYGGDVLRGRIEVLPPIVMRWIAQEKNISSAINLTSDLKVAGESVEDTKLLLDLIGSVLSGPSKANAIPSMREAMRSGDRLLNRLAQLKALLMESYYQRQKKRSRSSSARASELKRLKKRLDALPTSKEQYVEREARARKIYQRMRHELVRNQLRLDQQNAMIVAIERFTNDEQYTKGVSPGHVEALQQELERHRIGVARMGDELVTLKQRVEQQRLSVGIGDPADRADARLRNKMSALARGELDRINAARLKKTLALIVSVESTLQKFMDGVERQSALEVAAMKEMVHSETKKIERYRRELFAVTDEANDVVAGVTFEHFINIKDRFVSLLLKADMGVIDAAWLRKEAHGTRIKKLTKSRLRELRQLDAEFKEVRKRPGVIGE